MNPFWLIFFKWVETTDQKSLTFSRGPKGCRGLITEEYLRSSLITQVSHNKNLQQSGEINTQEVKDYQNRHQFGMIKIPYLLMF